MQFFDSILFKFYLIESRDYTKIKNLGKTSFKKCYFEKNKFDNIQENRGCSLFHPCFISRD